MSKQVSFRETVLDQIGNFLLDVGFDVDKAYMKILKSELVEVANLLSDYYEEGTHLFPEVVLLDNFEAFVKMYPCIHNVFFVGEIKEKGLQRAIKMCAPLADNGWNIIMEVRGARLLWGVVNVELSAVVSPLYNQIKEDSDRTYHLVYIKNIGMKTVEFLSIGGTSKYQLSLSLKNINEITKNEVAKFCDVVVSDVNGDKTEPKDIIEKVINTAIQKGHGNLIVVIKDEDEKTRIPDILKNGVGVTAIDFPMLYYDLCKNKIIENHTCLERFMDLVVSMINHDGITVFTTKGKIVGYHYIVENNEKNTVENEGGSRHKAYSKLCMSPQILAVLMRTQEGVIKLNIRK